MTLSADSVNDSMLPHHGGGGGSNPTSARQFVFKRITAKEAVAANQTWHSVLPSIPVFHVQIAYGAFYQDRLYGVAMWGRPVARTICGLGWLELRRMALGPTCPLNTASRMLAYMAKDVARVRPDIVKLISYQDTQFHKGTIYRAAGWTPVDMSSSPVNWGGHSQTKTPPTRVRKAVIAKAPKVRWELKVNQSSEETLKSFKAP